jgi:hypothetical protein
MFGLVYANTKELTKEQRQRYNAVYCGICRSIREQCSQTARFGLSFDMAFLALLLMSLYEPDELSGKRACNLHPIHPRPWVDNDCIQYSAAMNIALAYYKAQDDLQDEGKRSAKWMANIFGKEMDAIRAKYPRQCEAMEACLQELADLEKSGCDNPDLPAGVFGKLLGELFVYKEDLWANSLRQMGDGLGRYIYLADAAMDCRKDEKKKQYNPFLLHPADPEQYLLLAMGRCTDYYERLPLVQDKEILDNILYSGIWITYRARSKRND